MTIFGARAWQQSARVLKTVESRCDRQINAGSSVKQSAGGFELAVRGGFGHAEIVHMLLDAGEDTNRYNPRGFQAHSTPLHQAAFAGHDETVRLLVEHRARLDMRDTLWQGTPADWATHGNRMQIAEYLLSKERSARSTHT